MPWTTKIPGIYKLTNRITNKSYIGQSRHIKRRWSKLGCSKLDDTMLIQKAVAEYGWHNFDKKILIICADQEDLDKYEDDCIRIYDTHIPNGYNVRGGGVDHFLNDETTIKKLRTDRNWSEEGRKRVEPTQFKKGAFTNSLANKTEDEKKEISKRIGESLRQRYITNPETWQNKKYIPEGDVKQCVHCECFRKIEDFLGFARWASKTMSELKTCNVCRTSSTARQRRTVNKR